MEPWLIPWLESTTVSVGSARTSALTLTVAFGVAAILGIRLRSWLGLGAGVVLAAMALNAWGYSLTEVPDLVADREAAAETFDHAVVARRLGVKRVFSYQPSEHLADTMDVEYLDRHDRRCRATVSLSGQDISIDQDNINCPVG